MNLFAGTDVDQKIMLVKDGQPQAAIVIAPTATRAAQFGAFELQAHIKEITGATLPIEKMPNAECRMPSGNSTDGRVRILVGESQATTALGLKSVDFKPQEYLVGFRDKAILLMGCDKPDAGRVVYDISDPGASFQSWPDLWDERGTLHACYEFLEKFCGVRWFNPTEFGMDCPKSPTLEVSGRQVRRAPAFRFRDTPDSAGGLGEGYDALVALWPGNSDGFKAWEAAAYPKLHAKFDHPGTYMLAKRARGRLFQLHMREGGERVQCNHSMYGYLDRFWEKNPARPDLFVEKKTDWFAQGYEGKPPQMCYTSPGLIQQQAQDARDYFDGKKTGAQLGIFWQPQLPGPFPIETMDNDSYCKCDRCRRWLTRKLGDGPHYSKGIHSEYFFQFVNAVAREARRTHPDRQVVTLAYMTHAYPPESFKLEPNVAVQFCFAWNRVPYHEEYAHEIQLLRQWAKQNTPLYLWLYYAFPVEIANNGKFHCFPGFFAHKIGEQFKLFHQLGVRGMFHCGYGQEVEAYVTYKLMDDPTLDVDALLDEYFTRLYGPAGEPLRKMYLFIEQAYCNPANYAKDDRHQTMQIAWGKLGTPERLAQLGEWMDKARTLAETEIQKKRVALFEQSVWSYLVAGRKHFEQRTGAPIPEALVARVESADGDPARIDWNNATPLGAGWHVNGQYRQSSRKLSARLAHDGEFLYLELTDPVAPAKLQSSATVFPYDTWEIFVAAQRAQPYRQFAIGPAGQAVCLSYGEVNWQQGTPMKGLGLKVVSDTAANDRWIARVAIPLENVVPGGIEAGGKFFLNIARVTSPQLAGSGAMSIDIWVPFTTVHEVDRLAEITLAR
ncbi:MAG: DUF4838 domain-containing protein [Verrucomicrobia bacterium]|nr:DUF4838 domain-containing protein [Verrucomicrobiota bacterium]